MPCPEPAAVQRGAGTAGVRTAAAVSDSVLSIGGHTRESSGVGPAALGGAVRLDFVSGSIDAGIPGGDAPLPDEGQDEGAEGEPSARRGGT